MRALILAACVFAVGGCGSSESPAQDLAVPSNDLSIGDLATAADLALPPVDLAGWCVGTTLAGVDADGGATNAGECVRQYFLQFADCFRPAGLCNQFTHNSGVEGCWDDGAYSHTPSTSPNFDERYWMNSRVCLTEVSLEQPYQATSPFEFCASSGTSDCTSELPDGGGQFAIYQNGVFTCPDGTRVSIDLHGCPALNALLAPDCPGGGGQCTPKSPPF